jgi:Na+/phosphate symporter
MKDSQIFILVGVAFLLVGIIILEPVISGGLATPTKFLENKAYLGGVLVGVGVIIFSISLFKNLTPNKEQYNLLDKPDETKV